MRTLTRESRNALTPTGAIEVLRKGNERFVNNLRANRNLLQQVNETSDGQPSPAPGSAARIAEAARSGCEVIHRQRSLRVMPA